MKKMRFRSKKFNMDGHLLSTSDQTKLVNRTYRSIERDTPELTFTLTVPSISNYIFLSEHFNNLTFPRKFF